MSEHVASLSEVLSLLTEEQQDKLVEHILKKNPLIKLPAVFGQIKKAVAPGQSNPMGALKVMGTKNIRQLMKLLISDKSLHAVLLEALQNLEQKDPAETVEAAKKLIKDAIA
jgi:hypothetical protein